jgi:thiamine-phosphate pyrophosphorylase
VREPVAWRTMAITDRTRLGVPRGAALADVVRVLCAFAVAAAEAGVDALQLREYDMPDGWLRRAAAAMCAAVDRRPLTVLVNERAHVARVAGAAGVHLRSTGMPASRVRPVVGEQAYIGRSVHLADELAPDELVEVDYVLFGTVFPSASKAPGHAVAGLEGLRACRAQVGTPVLAVGGVTLERCADVAAQGAVGVAAIGLFADAWRQRPSTGLADLVARVHDAWTRAETR